MQTLEKLKEENLVILQKDLKYWEQCEMSPAVANRINVIKNQIEHLDELVQIQIVHSTHHLIDLVCQHKDYKATMAGAIDFKPDDDVVIALKSQAYPQIARDNFVQMVYESYGYTDKLPTYDDIRSMESSLKNSQLSQEEKEKLQSQIAFAKRKLGIGNYDGGMPCYFPSELTQTEPTINMTR